MKAGVIIIGSLLWDTCNLRQSWRDSQLLLDQRLNVSIPIRYGRCSQRRGDTFTMTFAEETCSPGKALVVPCKNSLESPSQLLDEAKELWKGEAKGHTTGTISARWGCVGVLFKNAANSSKLAEFWANKFHNQKADVIPPVNKDGLLQIPWPTIDGKQPLEFDVLLATVTKPDSQIPTAQEIASRWLNQHKDHEEYYFENIKNKIRTGDDLEIWKIISERQPDWLKSEKYSEAIAILKNESMSQTIG